MVEYGEWKATKELRFRTYGCRTSARILQQKWKRAVRTRGYGYDDNSVEYEWRDVPQVMVPEE